MWGGLSPFGLSKWISSTHLFAVLKLKGSCFFLLFSSMLFFFLSLCVVFPLQNITRGNSRTLLPITHILKMLSVHCNMNINNRDYLSIRSNKTIVPVERCVMDEKKEEKCIDLFALQVQSSTCALILFFHFLFCFFFEAYITGNPLHFMIKMCLLKI